MNEPRGLAQKKKIMKNKKAKKSKPATAKKKTAPKKNKPAPAKKAKAAPAKKSKPTVAKKVKVEKAKKVVAKPAKPVKPAKAIKPEKPAKPEKKAKVVVPAVPVIERPSIAHFTDKRPLTEQEKKIKALMIKKAKKDDNAPRIKLRIDARTIITVKSKEALKMWKEKYPNAVEEE